jgi:hypothetical protein
MKIPTSLLANLPESTTLRARRLARQLLDPFHLFSEPIHEHT